MKDYVSYLNAIMKYQKNKKVIYYKLNSEKKEIMMKIKIFLKKVENLFLIKIYKIINYI
jgi:hypothetical protein